MLRKHLSTFVLVSVLALLTGEHMLEAARNGSGTYVVPTTATPNSTISSADWNTNFSDVGSEITNSLPRDGQAGMSGQFKAADGSLGLPGVTFGSDTDTGFYRSASNEITFVAGGVAQFVMNASGTTLVPVGSVSMYAGSSSPPTGWLTANGSAVSRTTYATLFTAIGTTYGSGDGSTTFTLPDCTGRFLAGKEASDTRLTASGTGNSGIHGGTLGATTTAQNFTILQTNLPAVSLSAASLTGTFTGATSGISFLQVTGSNANITQGGGNYSSTSYTPTGTVSIGGSVPLGGNGTALGYVPPTLVLNCIIKY